MKHTVGVGVWILAILASGLQAQTPDASIGRNIPGGVAQQAPDSYSRERTAIEEKPELPDIPIIGEPGKGLLRKIIFSGALDPEQRTDGTPLVEGVHSDQVDLIQEHPRFAEALAAQYLGEIFTAVTVQDITKQTLQFYFKKERPLVFVQPAYVDYDNGVLKIIVIEARLDQKQAVGAKWFSNALLKSNLRMRSGQYINRMRLLNDVEWINQNPFLQSQVVVKPGGIPGTTNIILETKDRFPVRAFGSIDNTGSEQTGPWRWTLGANWGNAFFLGHQLNFQFSSAIESIQSQPVYAASYLAPLPWHHTFTIYGSYAGTDIDFAGSTGAINYHGYQSQISPRYTIPIGRLYGKFTHELTIGMDWKSTDMSFVQGGDVIPSNKTSVWQFMAGYNASLADDWGMTTLGFEMYWSPGGLGGNNTDSAYQEVDPRLQSNYLYGVVRASRMTKLPWSFSLVNQFTGQFASTSLISSEQLAIGGWGTVRGYDERVLFGDQGLVINVELRTPSFSPSSWISSSLPKDGLQFLAFWDFGLVNTIEPLPGDPATSYLTSVGIGVRYDVASNLSVRCDVGFPLYNPDLGFPVDTARASVGVTLGF